MHRAGKQEETDAPNTIRRCDLCLRRAGAARKGLRRLKKSGRTIRALFWWLRYSAFFLTLGPPKPRSRFTALGEPKIFALVSVSIVQIISLMVGPSGRWHPRICSMAVVWTFNVPDAGTRRVFSIEDRIWDGQRTSVSATVGRTLGASRGVRGQIRTRGGRLGEDFKAASLQRHFWARNAPYAVKDRGNPLKLQQMRPPSEREPQNQV
jgi:hypothetical protein